MSESITPSVAIGLGQAQVLVCSNCSSALLVCSNCSFARLLVCSIARRLVWSIVRRWLGYEQLDYMSRNRFKPKLGIYYFCTIRRPDFNLHVLYSFYTNIDSQPLPPHNIVRIALPAFFRLSVRRDIPTTLHFENMNDTESAVRTSEPKDTKDTKWTLTLASERPNTSYTSSTFIEKLRTRICEYFDE